MSVKKIVTPEYRLSYAHLVEPKAVQGSTELKYSVAVLIPKTDKAFKKVLDVAIAEMQEENKDKLKPGKGAAKDMKLPIGDGDETESPEYAGHWFINANSKDKPLLLTKDGKQVNELLDTREVYSGMYGKVSFNLFAFNTAGNRGIACGLNSVCKTRDGEPLGGTYTKADAAKDFGGDDDNNSSAALEEEEEL